MTGAAVEDDDAPPGAALEAARQALLASLPKGTPKRVRVALERGWHDAVEGGIDRVVAPAAFRFTDPQTGTLLPMDSTAFVAMLRDIAAAGAAASVLALTRQLVDAGQRGGQARARHLQAGNAARDEAIRASWRAKSEDISPVERARLVLRELHDKAKKQGWTLPLNRQVRRIGASEAPAAGRRNRVTKRAT